MKRKLLPITALLVFGMVGCESKKPEEVNNQNTVHVEPENAAVSISNKAVLQGSWYVGGSKTVSIELTPTANAIKAAKDGDLKITCNDPEAFDITGLGLNAKKAGTFTITAQYFTKTDTVQVTVSEVAAEPSTVKTTVANLLDNWSTLVATEKGTKFEIEAYITAWASGKTDGQKYGNFFIGDSVDATKTLYVYGCSSKIVIEWDGKVPAYSYTQGDDAKDWLTSDLTKDAVIGGKVKLEGIAYTYSGTKEISCKLISYEAPPKVDPQTMAISTKECTLEAGKNTTLKAILGPAGAAATVTWTSSDSTVASVDTTGKVTAVKAGKATITATLGDFTSIPAVSCVVNVKDVDTGFVVAETPVAGTAYKLGLAQYNKLFNGDDLYYFFNGKMNGNYVDTAGWNTAVDVFVETVEDGKYYMYFNNATNGNEKTYIEPVIDGTYVNCKFVTTTPLVTYKWDATYKTFACDINNGTYAIGTSNTSAYNTIGPRKVDNNSFFAQLYSAAENVELKDITTKVKSIEVGESVSLNAAAFPITAPLGDVTYQAGDDTIISVNNQGVITGVGEGETTVTMTSGSVTSVVTIKVVNDPTNYGTVEAPLTAAQALAVAEAQCKNNGDFTRKMVTVKGVMTNYDGYFNNGMTNNYVGKYTVNSGDKAILVNNSKATGEGVQGSVTLGDEVVVKGYITKDATLGYEFLKSKSNEYPEIIGFGTRGTGSIAVDAKSSDKATVTLPETKTGPNGSSFSFTVSCEEGYKVVSVKVGGAVVTADDNGVYNSKFSGNQTIVVEAVAADETVVSFKNSHAAVGTWADTGERTFKIGDVDFKSTGMKTGNGDQATNNYGYFMLNNGYIACLTSADSDKYISNVTVKFTGGTGETGKVVIELSGTANSAKTSQTLSDPNVKKNGSIELNNTDQTKKFFTISEIAGKNAQISEIIVTYKTVK